MRIEYLAGLAEGEGSFGMTGQGHSPIIRIAMTDKDVIDGLLVYGGRINEVKRKTVTGKTVWLWSAQGPIAIELMERLLPHMGKRRSDKITETLNAYYAHRADMAERGTLKHSNTSKAGRK